MEKKLLIFDIGEVMCTRTSIAPIILEYLNISAEEFLKFSTKENIKKIQTGKMTTKEFWNVFSKNSGIKIEEDLWFKFFKPKRNEEMYKFAENMKKSNTVAAGTNTIEPHYDILLKEGNYTVFERVYASHIIGLAKPDPQFYSFILLKEGFSPEDSFLIDDSAENIKSANNAGINGILYTPYEFFENGLLKTAIFSKQEYTEDI